MTQDSSGSGRVLVIGGGIAGLTSALQLARSGQAVDLVERDTVLGGHAMLFTCKATDRCQKCTVCMVNDRIREILDEPLVRVRTGQEVVGVERADGRFQVRLKSAGAPVDAAKCIACGLCTEECPTTPEPSISLASDQGMPRVYRVSEETCLVYLGKECERCVAVCPTEAIAFGREREIAEETYGGIIVATGYRPFAAERLTQYGYRHFPDVITGLDLEMRLRREGRLTRPSDGSVPKRVAFIQCVGSRDVKHNRYCSRVCCAYAVRCANKLSYLEPESEIAIFYMDLQAFGKDFAGWRDRLRGRVRLVRSHPAFIEMAPEGGLRLAYESVETNQIDREPFDLIVLSVGLCPGSDTAGLAEMLGIGLDEDGFLLARAREAGGRSKGEGRGGLGPDETLTQVPGLFLAGTCQGPRDIAGSIGHASAAAGAMLHHLRGSQLVTVEERDDDARG
ncbi:MAG: hypothetical protein AMJ46_07785 [Latescibacteria bacterium DG_63]|uniref:4Fe-4S ferredoxin-type domain-containing protein n=2 Tax=Bacteria division TA06 TaxID=1156500 RepID=A0A0S8JJ16_UNCT6|nr:MAG: hypothetical protein AMJ46_07785 [Latescibacteria bacterium DG_63]KPK67661.1 MAG: hypothetical protein AMJ82_10180 [candidate division TA06 bacterium SM23_40]KPL09362.1 MAG: hypothetical protein AMJ71_06615 [candidate division TA06 bacterium SM1_40]